jgi:hypothetical protein
MLEGRHQKQAVCKFGSHVDHCIDHLIAMSGGTSLPFRVVSVPSCVHESCSPFHRLLMLILQAIKMGNNLQPLQLRLAR